MIAWVQEDLLIVIKSWDEGIAKRRKIISSYCKSTVYSFTVNYRAPHPGFADELPFVTAIVELKEGVCMMTHIVQCDPEEVTIGMPVRVVFEPLTDDVTLLKFRPA
jgi:hypothetical protein